MRLTLLLLAAITAAEPRACLEGKLRRGALGKERIEMAVAGTEVTLRGNVKNAARKGAATRAARTCGFHPVRNELAVTPNSGPRRTAKVIPGG